MKTPSQKKIVVIPCSGIGKAFGSVSREATYELTEDLRKESTETVCLALLVSGDEDSLQLVRNNKCITVDGCPLQCAEKNVRLAGGDSAASFRVVDVFKKNTNLKPRSVTFLDRAGEQLAALLAEEMANKVDELLRER